MSNKLTNKQIQHLYWRAGFGISYRELQKLKLKSKDKIIAQLLNTSEKNKSISIELDGLLKSKKNLTIEERKAQIQLRNKKTFELNSKWIEKMETTKGVLRERMTLFFQNHFAVRLQKPTAMYRYHKIINNHALGNFGDLLMDISKSAAMLQFLNNRQNRKKSPNENFAREVMELFTLGRDNGYTQNDIKEVARAFTGWDFNQDGDFVFKEKRHDKGVKTIFGKKGNFSGEEVIQLLLKEKQTALYVTQKLYKYMVNDILDETIVNELADTFYESNYDIKTLLNAIFTSDWFYEEKNIGVKIKSPIDLIVGLNRQFKIDYIKKDKTLLFLQRRLNQILFQPPNVAGWPGGKHWIDSSTLMVRLKLPTLLMFNGGTEIFDDDITSMNKSNTKKKNDFLAKKTKTSMNWKRYLKSIDYSNETILQDFFLQPKLSSGAIKSLEKSKNKPIENQIVAMLSLPEYQLC